MRMVLLIGLALAVFAASSSASVAPANETYRWSNNSPIEDPYCLNEDDILNFSVAPGGTLSQGETWTYTPSSESCQTRTVWGSFVFKGAHGSDHPAVTMTVTTSNCYNGCPARTFTDDGVLRRSQYDCFFGKPCWRSDFCFNYDAFENGWPPPDPAGRNNMTLTLTNNGPGVAQAIYLTAENASYWVHTC